MLHLSSMDVDEVRIFSGLLAGTQVVLSVPVLAPCAASSHVHVFLLAVAWSATQVHAALFIAFVAHDGQKRKSGEPYIIHPVAVAAILGDLGMDAETIIAGLLHDTVRVQPLCPGICLYLYYI